MVTENPDLEVFRIDSSLYAANGSRFVNFTIDVIAILFSFFLFGFCVRVFCELTGSMALAMFIENIMADSGPTAWLLFEISAVVGYYVFFEVCFAKTIGKYITRTSVVDEFGKKPKFKNILLRTFCRLIPFEPLSFFGEPGKSWHDSISKTYVVKGSLLVTKKEAFYSLKQIGQNL